MGLVGTNRLRTETSPTRLPGGGAPLFGISGRWSALAWRDGASAGLLGGIRMAHGAIPSGSDAGVRATLVEPTLAVDVRHGVLEGSLSPFFRYGGGVALLVLDPNVSATQSAVGVSLHLGVGLIVADGPVRPMVELRGHVVPRTDGYVTRFHPAVGIEDWTWFPGSANVALHVGVAIP